jgi:spore coat polysaccharide biosynthesis protein SpsF
MKVVAIIQARMGSTRLPGKVMKDLGGQTVLARVVNRTRRATLLDEVVVATSTVPGDDVIVEECRRLNVPCFRGDENDVLDRYYQCARQFQADVVVRITSDCPLIDWELIDVHVERLKSRWHEVDFVTNMMRQSFPLGLAVEAMPMDVLARMKRMSQTEELREHVTTLAYIEPKWFQVDHVTNPENLSHMRWTVDTHEDLKLVRFIFDHFRRDRFSWKEVLSVLEQHPEWAQINRGIAQKAVG